MPTKREREYYRMGFDDGMDRMEEDMRQDAIEEENAKKFKKIYGEVRESFNILVDLGIMEDKYDFRSNWELSFNDHDELKSFGKYQIREVA